MMIHEKFLQRFRKDAVIRSQHRDSFIYNQKSMFVVHAQIGAGGFGSVLAVTLQHTGKFYALKKVNKVDLMKHKSGNAMIFGELQSMARAEEHPFVISLQLSYHDRLHCYFLMDLKTGGDLRYYLKQGVNFQEQDVSFYVACMSSALDHIHSKNMIHRDIKPENIMLDELGWPHLTDFGVAHASTPASRAEFDGTLTCTLASGTKMYLAPELFCTGHIHGPESDFWSLAVVAYELLYGVRPYKSHCSKLFIDYLEKALALQRKRTKEAELLDTQHREWAETGRYSPATSASMFSSSSPRASFDTSGSASTSRESSGFFPGISTSRASSFDEGHTGAGYSTSVHCTPEKGQSQPPLSPFLRRSIPAGVPVSPHAQRHSSQTTSRVSTRNHDTDVEVSGDNTAHFSSTYKLLGVSSPVRPSTTGRGIGFSRTDSTKHLPPLDTSACPPSPRLAKFAPQLPTILLPSPLQQHQPLFAESAGASHSNLQPAPYGDHWAVSDKPLRPELCVPIPENCLRLTKPITPECVSFLREIFDIRPSLRLSSRNIDGIRTHSWMRRHGLDNWERLHKKRSIKPNFQPGKYFIREMMADPANKLLAGGWSVVPGPTGDLSRDCFPCGDQMWVDSHGDDSAEGTGGTLTHEEHLSFRGFHYASKNFLSKFPRERAHAAQARAASSASSSSTSSSQETKTDSASSCSSSSGGDI